MLKPQKDKKNTDDWQYKAGIRGEKLVRQKLNQLDSRYKTLNDIHYRNAQIDHIVEYHGDNPFVIVIETKTWGGCVSGKVHDKHWIQKENGLTKEYYNPIKQNNRHCELLRYKYSCPMINLVVFAGSANPPKIEDVITLNNLLGYIEDITTSLSA